MSFKAMQWAWNQELPALEKYTLLAIADFYNEKTNQCNPSLKAIAEKTGLSKRKVADCIYSMREKGLITVIEVKNGLCNSSNQYALPIAQNATPIAHDARGIAQDAIGGIAQCATKTGNIEPVIEPFSSSLGESKKQISEPELKAESEPTLTAEIQGCYEWAMQHDFWKNSVTSISKFLTLYTNNKPNGLKAQYIRFQQAQKNPLESDGNQAGFQSVNTTKVINYENYSRKSNTKKLSTADKQLYSIKRGEIKRKFDLGLISESEYRAGMQQYATS